MATVVGGQPPPPAGMTETNPSTYANLLHNPPNLTQPPESLALKPISYLHEEPTLRGSKRNSIDYA